MFSIRSRVVLVTGMLLAAAVSQAQSVTHAVYIDLDRNPATGCSVATPAGAVSGAEVRVVALRDHSSSSSATR